jgi:hypothetical protein
VVVAGQAAAAVEQLVAFGVAEHVFEVLRDMNRPGGQVPGSTPGGGRGGAGNSSRNERDAVVCAALDSLTYLAAVGGG